MRRLLLAVPPALVAAPAFAAVDAEAAKPYDVQIVLKVAPLRFITPTFRRQLETDLRDAMQAALGTLGQVEVLNADAKPDAWLPLTALDAQTRLGPLKRHFVQVDFADGQFVVTARQHDGSTGQASPRVRRAQTSDPAFVARLATQFLGLDFGPIGTIVGKNGDTVRLQLRGSAIPNVDMNRWVVPGSVFALTRLEGEPRRGRTIPFTYLQVIGEPKDGICECRLVSRYLNPLPDWPQIGYRAMRLGTTTGHVRIRFVDPNSLPHQNLLVALSAAGFRSTDAIAEQGSVRDGWYTSHRTYSSLAFVRALAGDRQSQIPVPIIDDQPVICELDVTAGGEARQQFELDVKNVRQRLQDIRGRLSEQNRQLEILLKESKNREALDRIQAGLELLDSETGVLTGEVLRLKRESGQHSSLAVSLLDQCDVFLREIRSRRESLGRIEAELAKAVKSENSAETQARRDDLLGKLQRAESQREEADFDGAIRTYEEILAEFGARPDVKLKLDDLKTRWAIKNEDHRRAREFAYSVWGKIATFDDVRANLPKAKETFDVCRAAGDKLTALKFSLAASAAAEIVIRSEEELEQSSIDADVIKLKQVRETRKDLQAFLVSVSKFIRE